MKLFIIVPLMLQNYPYPCSYLIELRLELILKYSLRNFLQICYKIHEKSLNLIYSSEFGRKEKSIKGKDWRLKQQYNNWWENCRTVNVAG
jgi:hypothetical protein